MTLFSFMPILALQTMAGGIVALVGIGLIIVWLMIRGHKQRKQNCARPTAREQLERLNERGHMRDDLQRLMVEIEQMAKRVSAQLDAKTIEVEQLLDRTEAKMKELRQLHDNAHVNAAPPHPVLPQLPEDPLTQSVYQLADAGLEPPQIAGELNEHVGKVELILALRQA